MKKVLSALLMAVMVLTLVSCASPSTSNEPKAERVLRIDGENLGYPSVYTSSPKGRGYMMVSYIFDTLVWKDENGLVPLLADSWTVADDNVTYTFNLNKEVTFSDGKPLTGEDVKFSFEYLKEHPYQWVSVEPVKEVNVIDEQTVEIILNKIYVPFITDIAGNVPIMPKHIWEGVREPEKFNSPEAVIGSGPLTLESFDEATGVYIYNKNENYFLGDVQIDKLIISPVENTKEALLADEIDMAINMKYGEAMKLKEENTDYTVIEGPGLWVGRMYMNFGIEALNVKELRQAMYYAINRDELVSKVLKGAAEPGNPGHIHPLSQWYYDGVKQYDYSVETAKELLAQAEIVDSNGDGIVEYKGEALNFEFIVPEDQVNLAEMVKLAFGEIGIGLEVKAMDSNTLASLIKDGKFQLAFNGHGSFGGDPVLLKRFVNKDGASGSTPAVTTQGGENWYNEEFNEIFDRQIIELDEAVRYEEVAKLQEIIAEELPTLTLYYKKTASAYNPKTFDGWFYTKDGVSLAVPTVHNKLVFVKGKWMK